MLKIISQKRIRVILGATASMCKISSSINGKSLLFFQNKALIADSSDNEFIVISFSLCMTTVYIVSLNANITKIEIRPYYCRLTKTNMVSIKTRERK